MHNIWIATDLHLYNVENDPRHPYRTQRNLGNLADNYGSDIQDDDLLIFLGDLYDPATGDAEKVSSIIHNIKGTKIMCRGNHDTESKDFYRELGFDAVCDILRIHNLVFSHKPVRVNPDELNIHGHLHSEKLSSLGYQHINAYPINHNKEDQPVLIEDLIDSAIVQNRDEVHGPSFNQQQMDAFTSLVSNETYHDVLDLSDEFTMSPMDEAATTKRKKTEAEKLYFLSEHDDWDESIIKPRIPNNFLTQSGYEDATIPRVCFSTFTDGCLRALSQNLKGKVFYVYQPVGKYEVIKPTLEQVPDRAVTRERWITKPVELHCIGKIQVGEAKDDGIKYVYGEDNEHSAMLYDWEWEWIEKIDESVQPSIVSLSATSKKDPRLKRNIMDEILFPDVDSTCFFEADDNAPETEADLKKNIKMLDKNDVAADGQTTLDESSHKKKKKKKVKTPEMVFTFIKPGERETTETISILAQDLFHEKIMIHPERIDVQKIATMERVGELIEYFERTAEGEAIDKYGVTSDHYIAGSFLLNAYRDKPEHKEIEDILIPDLPPEEFKQYVKDTIEYLNQVESAICGLICANMAMIRLSIDDVCAECLTPYGRNKVIEEAKQLVDDYEKDIKSTYKYYANSPYTGDVEEFKTIVFDYGPVGLRKKVVISGMMYDNKVYKNLMKPSRYLVRFGVYDVVIVVHGRTTFTENGGYRWDIEPLQVDKGVTVTDMNSAIQYFRNKYHGRILVTSCNEAGIVPDDKLYDMVDFASHTVLFESTDVGLPATVGSTSSMLKSLINYVPKKIKALNRTEARIVTALDEFNFLATPTEFDYINVDEKLGHVTVSIKSKKIKGPKDFRVEMGSSLNELFMYYEKVLYRFMMFGKLIQQHMSGVIVENGYTWNIQGINLKALTPSFDAVNQDLFVYDDMPSLGYRYTDIDEYTNDIELFRATNAWFYGDITLQSDSINEDTYDAWKDIYYKITNPMTINIANVSETPDVLFTKVITPESLVKIFQLAYMPAIPDGWKTMVKISTGEPGGHNYLKPELIGELVKLVHGTICDTVTAYEGGRDTKEGQLKTMKDHGFTEIGNVDVLDGDGEIVVPVKNGYMLQDVNAGKNILGYDFHIILTHFKGHQMAGFGGSIKNVAIGCASRRGKSQIHTYGSTAEMTVGFLDQYDQQSFLKAMVDAAKSFVDVMKITGPILYINIANNLSVDCDCNAHPADPTMADLGIFASWDPVAVDSACIDAVYYAKDSKDLVERIESKDGTDILEYAQEAGMGSRSYHLIDIDQIDQPITEATKEYKRMDDIHPIDREEKKKIADKYGLRAVGQELPEELREKEKTPEERYKELHEKRVKSLKKARKVKKRKAFTRKVKSHLPGVKNEDVELFYEDAEAVDNSDDSTPDGVEHSPLYGDKKDFFYNYDYPKDANAYAERMKLEESTHASTVDPSHKQKGRLSLESLKHITVDEKWRKANVPDHPWLRHFASADQDTDVSAWLKNGDIADSISEAVADASDITVKKTDTTNPNDHESRKAVKLSFYKNKEHIGTVFISGVDTRKGFLYDFKVAKKFRGMGYGTMIMKYVLSNYYVTDLSVDEDNKVAISLYKKFGFKRKQAFYDKSQKKTYDWYQRSSVLLHDNPIKEDNKLNETSTKVDNEDPLTKQELASLGIRDLRTLQRWMKNNIRYKNFTQLMTPREVLKEKKGSCHDQVVFEMAALKALDYSPTAYFVLEHDDKPNSSQGGETHSYVVVKDNGRLYWLENAWEQYAGVNEITNPKFIKQAHKERAWGDSNKFKELEVVRFAGQPGDSLQQLVDHCFNDKQEIDKPKKKESVVETGTPIWETYQFELEEPIQFLDRMDETASNSSKSHVYTEPLYRITYNDIGIYEAYKKACSFDEWRSFINSDAATWLDVPKIYNKDINHTSYFTKRGYELFQKNTYPVIIQKLNKRNIKVDQVVLDVKPVYEDLYQVVVPNSVNESSIQDSYQFELLDKSVHFYDKIDEAASYQAKGKLYPVYVVLVHSGTGVSKAIKAISHSEYSHASICFDSSLDKMYSFARKDPRNPFIGGFRYESIGKGFYEQKEIPYAVYVVPCTESQVKKMKKRLNYFIQNQEKFTFDFTGLVTNYLGIVNNPAHRWFCSRFVADILNAGAPKKNPYVEEPSLQDPDDFKNTDYATYVIGGSDLMKYDQKLVDKRTKQILREEEMSRKVQNESVTYDLDRDNPFGDLVLGYQFAMMDESVVDRFLEYLKSFKLKFDKNGNIVIRRREYDQLDTHFRQSLKLIKAAEKAGNLDTVKYELCKIYYMISLIDRHYLGRKASDKSEKVRKDMINLRAVMINVMHQHLKYVSTMDPQFNFQSYYASTKYGDDTTISPQFLTAFGRTIVTALN